MYAHAVIENLLSQTDNLQRKYGGLPANGKNIADFFLDSHPRMINTILQSQQFHLPTKITRC